ncbi:uncharacterized protein LOC117769794 [Hippoglossus hippoglossus]|uniref:uncharacterized protein LOC117769794 n=1 Tax=Hippoglossus hippoglossus TaxID=8267 RepID=UPI00148C1001|nr:uncharacterized protein LOC117769794 [Hippoglossus hippoglossus]
MPRGSTNTTCVGCKAVIGVVTKTCKFCQAVQPRRQRLAKKLQTFEAKKEGCLENQKKNKTTAHVMDEATNLIFLLEKLHTLGHRAIIFHAKPGKKPSTWYTHVLHPKWQLSDQAEKCLDRMKALYEVLVHGWSNQYPSTHQPSIIPANQPPTLPTNQPPTIQPTTSSLNYPSTSSANQPTTSSLNYPSTSSANQPPTIQPTNHFFPQYPSTISANQPPTIQLTTSSLNYPSTSSDIQPPSDSEMCMIIKMARPSPTKLPSIDDGEVEGVRRALQIASYACMDEAVGREELYRLSNESHSQAMACLVKNVRLRRAAQQQAALQGAACCNEEQPHKCPSAGGGAAGLCGLRQ